MKIRKRITSAIVVGAFLLNASPSFAVVGIKPTMKAERIEARTTLKQERSESREEFRTTIGAQRDAAKLTSTQTRLEFRRTQLTKTYSFIKKNLETRFTYLTSTLKASVQAKINSKKTEGKNVTEAQAKLDSLSTTNYANDLSAFDLKYTQMFASTEPKKNLGDLNKLANNVRHDLNEIKKTLMDAFRLAIRSK